MTSTSDVQAVVFALGEERFALPVELVREILDHGEAFRLPNGPDWLIGLIDVRGEAVPIVDLRRRLGLVAIATTPATRVLMVDAVLGDRRLTLGLIVDRVLDVASFPRDTIEPVPEIGMRWNAEFIAGVVRTDRGFVVLLDLPHVFDQGSDQVMLVAATAVPVAVAA